MALQLIGRPSSKHCRCTSRACGKRFKGTPGVSQCPTCGRIGRLDTWAQARPWRLVLCYCDEYRYPHRTGGGKCCAGRFAALPPMEGLAGLPF